MNPILVQVISYAVVLLLALGIANFFLKGLLLKIIKVKGSRGKNFIAELYDVGGVYYRVGRFEESEIVYKDRAKNEKRLSITKSAVETKLTCKWIMIDDSNGKVINSGELFKGVTGFDPDKMNSLYIRALYKPSILDTKMQIMLLLLALVLLISIGNIFMNVQAGKKIQAVNAQVGWIASQFVKYNSTSPQTQQVVSMQTQPTNSPNTIT